MTGHRNVLGRWGPRRAAAACIAGLAALGFGAVLLLPSGGSAEARTAPSNTAEPSIVGTPSVGNTLTASNGSWSGTTPLSFSYRWLRCPKDGGKADGSNCGVISGADKSTYEVRNPDRGLRLRVQVRASNSDGSAVATSNPTDVVTSGRPSNTSPPTISGTPRVGQTLTGDSGSWSGAQPISFSVQWRRCSSSGGSCSDIRGATSRTYLLQSADQGQTLRIRVTARNNAGSDSATSVPTAVIGAAPVTGCPSGDVAQVSQVTPPARLVIDRLQFSPSVMTRSTHDLIARFHVVNTCGQPVQGALVYGTAVPFNQLSVEEQPTGHDGWAQLDLRVLSSFPLTSKQGLLVIFARARKPGDNLLAGISTRRLVSVRAKLQ